MIMPLDFQQNLRIEVDDPQDRILRHPINAINGWINLAVKEAIEARLVDQPVSAGGLRVAFYPRADLDPNAAVGFTIYLDLCGMNLDSVRSLTIALTSQETSAGAHLTMQVTDEAVMLAGAYHEARDAKKARIAPLLTGNVRSDPRCLAPSALPADWPVSPVLEEKQDAVSSHFYGPSIHEFLNSFPNGSIFLDAGAGLRKRPMANVVNMEIYDYPSTDILSIGQALPFKDNSFDGILSLAVLEHVDDPFLCARELARVLKPGGRILVMIPFLQAEHGYPSHYFNATRAGVVKLFEELELKGQTLERSNHPILTLHQVAGIYLSALPADIRDNFLAMPVREIFTLAEKQMKGEADGLLTLEQEKAFQIAWGTTSIFQKN